MKRLILISAFIGLFLTPTYSQINWQFKIDTTLKDNPILGYQKPIKLKLSDTIAYYSPLDGLLNNKHFQFPKFSSRNFDFGSKSMMTFAPCQFEDKMPCFRPQGYFPMAIAKSDSTVRYSLLIKRY